MGSKPVRLIKFLRPRADGPQDHKRPAQRPFPTPRERARHPGAGHQRQSDARAWMASSPLADSNCTVAGGVCVFPDATRGERYEAFIVTNDGTTDTFTVVAGSLRPGISLASNGTQGAIVIGTPRLGRDLVVLG